MTSLCVHVAAEHGDLVLDQPIAEIWPEFSSHGKDRITVRDVLTHQAGLQSVSDNDFALPHDAAAWRRALEAAVPRNPVGAVRSYHALTFGQILGELITRSTGQSARDFFGDHVTRPLAADVHIGVTEPMLARVCDIMAPSDADFRALSVPPAAAGYMTAVATTPNDHAFRTGVFPSGRRVLHGPRAGQDLRGPLPGASSGECGSVPLRRLPRCSVRPGTIWRRSRRFAGAWRRA